MNRYDYKRDKMSRYNNGQIYKLVNTVDDRIYVGSTCLELSKRLYAHKSMARKHITQRVYEALNTVGRENCRIILIESYPCSNKQELIAREQYFIDLLKPSLNKNASSGQKCVHNRRRDQCVECKGSSICEHGRQRAKCVECKGSQICQHDKRKSHCKICNPKNCEICDIIISEGHYNEHCQSVKHIANSSSESSDN